MNKKQKIILACTAIAIFLMLLFPPFYASLGQGATTKWGYHFIFWDAGIPVNVNVSLLMCQWLGALLIGGLLWFIMKDSDDSENFCAKCGTPISQAKSATPSEATPIPEIVQTIVKKPSKIYWIIYVVISIMIIGTAASLFIPLLANKKIDYQALACLVFWIGFAFLVRRKQKSQSGTGWLWFFCVFLGISLCSMVYYLVKYFMK